MQARPKVSDFYVTMDSKRSRVFYRTWTVRWNSPLDGLFKLNTDGWVFEGQGMAVAAICCCKPNRGQSGARRQWLLRATLEVSI